MPNGAEVFGLAVRQHQAGNLPQAEQLYRQVLQQVPQHVDALHMLGLIAFQVGRNDAASELIRQAIGYKPDFAEAHNNLGTVLQQLGRSDEAIASWRQSIAYKPSLVEAYSNLGLALKEQGKLDEAVATLSEAVRLKPDHGDSHNNLGAALHAQGRLDEAVMHCREAVRLGPKSAGAHCNLGLVLAGQTKTAEAMTCYRRALDCDGNCVEAHYNLGTLLQDQGDIAGAIACFRRVLQLKPGDIPTLALLVHALEHACQWEEIESLTDRLIELVDQPALPRPSTRIVPFSFLTLCKPTSAEQQLRCTQRWVDSQPAPPLQFNHAARPSRPNSPEGRLTIGYLSADYCEHATAHLIVELLERHDRRRFQVCGYSYGRDDGSAIRRRIQAGCDRFIDLRANSHVDAAARIHQDRVDILIDLKGHTSEARPEILAMRPAPVQVNYLGYPGTMGARYMDYILVDDFIVPADQQPFFTEKLVHLPGCYQVNDGQRAMDPRTPTRAECGLPETGLVFCCFNNSYKITPALFGVWMDLLRAVPGSVLWVLEGSTLVADNLRREAVSRGISPQRLVMAPRMGLPQHLARQRLADLMLDCFPVCAHTTASDALWAGCPLLTIAGRTFVTRVAGSLLRTVGLPELVVNSQEEYAAMALRLARNPAALADLRMRLAANRLICGLFDAGKFARNVEQAYQTMWQIHAAGQVPHAFAIKAS